MREPETSGSIAAMSMNTEMILKQLSSLKDNSESFASEKDADPIWQKDIEALEAAISMISVLQDEGIKDYDTLKDAIFDQTLLRKEYQQMHLKHRKAAKPIHKDGVAHCPDCNKRVHPNHTYCHWCGKLLGGR